MDQVNIILRPYDIQHADGYTEYVSIKTIYRGEQTNFINYNISKKIKLSHIENNYFNKILSKYGI